MTSSWQRPQESGGPPRRPHHILLHPRGSVPDPRIRWKIGRIGLVATEASRSAHDPPDQVQVYKFAPPPPPTRTGVRLRDAIIGKVALGPAELSCVHEEPSHIHVSEKENVP
jgi:hypothetical protein